MSCLAGSPLAGPVVLNDPKHRAWWFANSSNGRARTVFRLLLSPFPCFCGEAEKDRLTPEGLATRPVLGGGLLSGRVEHPYTPPPVSSKSEARTGYGEGGSR
jgi:hypothetical protein